MRASLSAIGTHRAAGLIDKSLNSSEFVPGMFDTTRRLLLTPPGAALSEELLLIGPTTYADRAAMGYMHSTDQVDPLRTKYAAGAIVAALGPLFTAAIHPSCARLHNG